MKEFKLKTSSIASIDSAERMWAAVRAARQKMSGQTLDERPPDSFTIPEFAKRFGVNHSSARNQLYRMAKCGSMVQHRVLMANEYGRVVATNIYTPVEK